MEIDVFYYQYLFLYQIDFVIIPINNYTINIDQVYELMKERKNEKGYFTTYTNGEKLSISQFQTLHREMVKEFKVYYKKEIIEKYLQNIRPIILSTSTGEMVENFKLRQLFR